MKTNRSERRVPEALDTPVPSSTLGELADPKRLQSACDIAGFSPDTLASLLRQMHMIRQAEEAIATFVERGEARCPCHLGIGQEAIAAGLSAHLRPTDRVFGAHRSHAHFLALGGSVHELMAEVLGRASGCSGGFGGSMHLLDTERGFFGSVPIVAATIPIAVGAGLALKKLGGDGIAVSYFGDGAVEEGAFHESLNLAANYQTPVLFVCENNLYASHLDIKLRQPADSVSRFAWAHCMPLRTIDGNDVTLVHRAAEELIGRIRAERAPAFLEVVTYRWRGHVGPSEDIDVGIRRSPGDLSLWKKRDPIRRLEESLLREHLFTQHNLERIALEASAEVKEAAQSALDAEYPEPSELLRVVYANAGDPS